MQILARTEVVQMYLSANFDVQHNVYANPASEYIVIYILYFPLSMFENGWPSAESHGNRC